MSEGQLKLQLHFQMNAGLQFAVLQLHCLGEEGDVVLADGGADFDGLIGMQQVADGAAQRSALAEHCQEQQQRQFAFH